MASSSGSNCVAPAPISCGSKGTDLRPIAKPAWAGVLGDYHMTGTVPLKHC